VALSGCSLTGSDEFTSPFDQTTAGYSGHHVTYDPNGATGTVPTDSAPYATGQVVAVAASTPSLTLARGTLTGWNTKADGSGTAVALGGQVPMGAADLTLFAQWTQTNPYSIAYDANTGSGSVPATVTNKSTGFVASVLAAPVPTLAHHHFDGWNTRADGRGTAFTVTGGTSTPATLTVAHRDIVLYAQWSPTYTVTYDGNGGLYTLVGTGVPPSDPAEYLASASVTVAGNTGGLAVDSYYFAGWNTKADGTGTAYPAGASLVLGPANVTLYAQWKQMPTFTSVTALTADKFPDIHVTTGGADYYEKWNPQNSVYYNGPTVAVSGDGSHWAIADRAGAALFWRSVDGTTWTVAKDPGYTSNDHKGDFFNQSWNNIAFSTTGAAAVTKTTASSPHGFALSTDGAGTWNATGTPGFDQGVSVVGISGDGTVLAGGAAYYSGGSYGGKETGIMISRDSGTTYGFSGSSQYGTLVVSLDGTQIFAGGVYNSVSRIDATGAEVTAPGGVVPTAPTKLAARGDGSRVYWADGTPVLRWWNGQTGSSSQSGTISIPTTVTHNSPAVKLYCLAMTPDGQTLLAGGDNWTLFLSPDGGATWEDVTPSYHPTGTNPMVTDVGITDDGKKWIASAADNTSTPGLWIGQ
jgi:hypothetical protein